MNKKYTNIASAFRRIRKQATEATKVANGDEPYRADPQPSNIAHFLKEIGNELNYITIVLKEIELKEIEAEELAKQQRYESLSPKT